MFEQILVSANFRMYHFRQFNWPHLLDFLLGFHKQKSRYFMFFQRPFWWGQSNVILVHFLNCHSHPLRVRETRLFSRT